MSCWLPHVFLTASFFLVETYFEEVFASRVAHECIVLDVYQTKGLPVDCSSCMYIYIYMYIYVPIYIYIYMYVHV